MITIDIPQSVTLIEAHAFTQCTGLISMEIPNSVISIGDYAFSACTSLTSIEIPNSIVEIKGSTFARCSNLESIDIPDSVTSIVNSAFRETALTSVKIPDLVTEIGETAFYCSDLTNILIGSSVTNIGDMAFYKWHTDLNNVYIKSIEPPTITDGTNLSASCVLTATSGVVEVENQDFWIKVDGNNIIICDVQIGETVRVFAADGSLISTKEVVDSTVAISVPASGLYFVKVGRRIVKVLVK